MVITRLTRNQLGTLKCHVGSNPTRSAIKLFTNKGGNFLITEQKKQTIKLIIAVCFLVLILTFVVISMIIYEVEGEFNMPFKLSKIVIIGTADGVENEQTQDSEETNNAKWNFDIYQNNDVYFYIDQNTQNKEEKNLLIKNVKISNIQVKKEPQKGTVKAFMPNSEATRLYSYDNQFLVDQQLEYKGASQSSSTNLQIGSKGGTALIRFSNTNITNYSSEDDEEIVHDGTWLSKTQISKEEIQFTVSFDFTIETTKSKYQTNITLELPTGNLGEEKNCYLEKTDMNDIVFKRVRK